MKAAVEMTERERCALEAMEGSRREGLKLAEYARRQDLVVQEIYSGIAALRRKGQLPKSTRRSRGRFVAVRVAPQIPPMESAFSRSPLCRIVRAGYVVECLQWPPPSWLAALGSEPADVAS